MGTQLTSGTRPHLHMQEVFDSLGREKAYIRIEPPPELGDVALSDWRAVPSIVDAYEAHVRTPEVAQKIHLAAQLILSN